ncbi:MAG TPA: class E sortase [Patescibacteria group bacterium]|nr:class E sortase [Patescibacteria group bacterium]
MRHFSTYFLVIGALCIFAGFLILAFTYYQLIGDELSYFLFHPNSQANVVSKFNHPRQQDIVPADEQFGIVIPKIRANNKVIANVDPFDEMTYQWALTKGVAHAKGSSLPYEKGTVFLFSHSSVNFYEAVKYNSIFYLLDKLKKGDTVYLFYKGTKYTYLVSGKTIVAPTNVSYLFEKTGNRLILMTCWPPGTTFRRLLVEAVLKNK